MRARLPNFVFSAAVFAVALTCSPVFSSYTGFVFQCVYAADQKQSDEKEKSAEEDAAALAEAQNEALKGQVSSVAKSLDQAELTHFGIIYTNYTVYSLVNAVREDVHDAVQACIKNNPGMEEQLQGKWDNWDKSVGTNMKEAMANINALSMAQDYVSQDKLKVIFSLVDKTRTANSSRFETVPVTTPDACEFMMSKMDETEESMNMLLAGTLQSYPNMMRAMQE